MKIVQVKTKNELIEFVKFPFKLYKGSKYWVPPIINEEVNSFTKGINPNLDKCDVNLFVAKEKSNIVGRIAIIINWFEVNNQKIKKVRFGWFDFIDDLKVSEALLEKASDICKKNNLDFLEGPIGFSNLDKVGVLTSGFNEISTMISWYNYPYYKKHFENLEFSVNKEYLENKFNFKNIDIDYYERMSSIVQKRFDLKPVSFNSTKKVLEFADQMFELFNITYSKLASFIPVNQKQINYMKDKFLSFINPEYLKFVLDNNNKLIGFAVIMPSFAKALQKANGSLFPFGFLHLLYAKQFPKNVTLFLIGVHPDFQKKGVTAILFNSLLQSLKNKGIKECIRTPELKDNKEISKLWKNFNPITYKTRCTYKKNI
ncbi:MAG: GNAT family N-acetyltransferase [Flavobacteriaceae bacterium]|nr:GNAT family N-acetyltransferase [Flavobacteriaceae bacterium]